jgi:UDP-N-acetylmuramate--alanine ligase
MHRYGDGPVAVYDDYAHNPEKIAAAIQALQQRYERVYVIFQPHGYGPLRFHLEAFAAAFSDTLRDQDALLFLPVFDAGGTTDRSITSADLVQRITRPSFLLDKRVLILDHLKENTAPNDAVLVAGARDDTLAEFAADIDRVLNG